MTSTDEQLPIYKRQGLFNFLNYWKTEQQPIQEQIPQNPKGFFANERTFLHWIQRKYH